MMAEQVFDRYIENADKVMDLSYAMLEKHIADQKELPDNTDVIQRKQGEIEKLMNKRTNLIEMRAEGDIDKEMFRSKNQEIEDRVAKLQEEIKGLQPEKELTSNEDYSVKLLELREHLKEYTVFDYSVIPESIVEAFIERIWVSKDEFRWYLRMETMQTANLTLTTTSKSVPLRLLSTMRKNTCTASRPADGFTSGKT